MIMGIFAGIMYDFLFILPNGGIVFEWKKEWPILIIFPIIACIIVTIGGTIYAYAAGILPT